MMLEESITKRILWTEPASLAVVVAEMLPGRGLHIQGLFEIRILRLDEALTSQLSGRQLYLYTESNKSGKWQYEVGWDD